MNGLSLLDHISIIQDPRQAWKIEHKLSDIIFLTVAAVIAGAEGWKDIEDFGEDNLEWLRQYGDFEHGVPVHDTIARVMNLISAKQLQKCFSAWMRDCHEAANGDVIAIDGKTIRGTYNKEKRCGAIHMVSAFSAANQVVLGQVKTAEKSNEITAIPELLKLLEIRGCLVTIDAMGCQKEIAKQIVDKGADYLFAVKGNQPKLEEAMGKAFNSAMLNSYEGDKYSTQEKGHGRTETRMALVSHDPSELGDVEFDWADLSTLGVVVSIRQEGDQPAEEMTIRYYISSAKLTAKELMEKSRAHWSIEVQMYWRLDVGMNEDSCRIQREHAGENLAVVRHIALNLLTEEKTFKAGIKRKQKKANRSNAYLSLVLAGQGAS
ncbi:ISAs1 family transposase [Vibrio sp. JC009]|uniref:ISAs1 family transposase n=1 Tax=Vibrio sp. JC009 TaxID=2912314 RepID=UPI0023B173AD|nr:ISAs1 family transposase [Vibrio sp. JC009]WED24147.1 ISAs1 family transposase [Vibrio sp. JC009]